MPLGLEPIRYLFSFDMLVRVYDSGRSGGGPETPFLPESNGPERAERNMGVRYVAQSRILGGHHWRISCVPL